MPAEGPYDERYCAFVDILGFGQLVDRLREGATRFEVIRDLLNIIHAPPEARFVKAFTTTDYKAQSISDAVCISALPSAVGLSHLFYSLEELTLRLLTQGFFLRGAIVRGRLYHDDRMVFGEALIRAFRLEQDVVRFPRIMVTREVVLDDR